MHPLDTAVAGSLLGAHAPLARRVGSALGFDPEVSPFVGSAATGAERWDDLALLLGPGGRGLVAFDPLPAPDGWREVFAVEGAQLIAEREPGAPDPEAVVLGADDVPEMLDLVARTRPGPFAARTIELGRYLGIRVDGRLVAMAGERFRPDGHVEVSAVCTDPEWRGRGLARRLVLAVVAGIRAEGAVPFLHVADGNPARALYEALGFAVRRRGRFVLLEAPGAQAGGIG